MKISLILYHNLLILSFFILSIASLASMANALYSYYKDLKVKSSDLYQYKITNFYYTFICMFIYIFLFILLTYYLRILYLNKTVDLKALYYYLSALLKEFSMFPFTLQLYISIVFFLCVFLILLVSAIIQTICFNEFFKFHIFLFTKYLYEKVDKRKDIPYYYKIYVKFVNLIGGCYLYTDPFSGSIIYCSSRIDIRFNLKLHYFVFYLFMNKYYKILYQMSPIIIIAYDCIFNNWVLFLIFYYMIIYSLFLIIKRVADNIFPINPYLLSILSDIYYKNHNAFVISMPLHLYSSMLESRLSNALKTNIELFFEGLEDSNYIFIMANKDFKRDKNNPKMLTNEEGLTIVKLPNGKLYRLEYEYEEGKYDLGEEWIILQDNTNKHENTTLTN